MTFLNNGFIGAEEEVAGAPEEDVAGAPEDGGWPGSLACGGKPASSWAPGGLERRSKKHRKKHARASKLTLLAESFQPSVFAEIATDRDIWQEAEEAATLRLGGLEFESVIRVASKAENFLELRPEAEQDTVAVLGMAGITVGFLVKGSAVEFTLVYQGAQLCRDLGDGELASVFQRIQSSGRCQRQAAGD